MTSYSGEEEQELVVHKKNVLWVFKLSKKGLYYSDLAHNAGATLVHSVDSNKSKYSIRQHSNTKKICAIQVVIGRQGSQDFIKYVAGNMIPNCNITRQDILRTEDIFARISEGQDYKTSHGKH